MYIKRVLKTQHIYKSLKNVIFYNYKIVKPIVNIIILAFKIIYIYHILYS